MKDAADYSEYKCPYSHIEKECGHEVHGPEGYEDTHGVWCACGFRGPLFCLDPEELKLEMFTEKDEKPKPVTCKYCKGRVGIDCDGSGDESCGVNMPMPKLEKVHISGAGPFLYDQKEIAAAWAETTPGNGTDGKGRWYDTCPGSGSDEKDG